jgi:hydroxymethylpyrimidine pyrophosphatase-like HAD family hydrolase
MSTRWRGGRSLGMLAAMQIAAFAFDYDGTLAHDGRVAAATLEALQRLKEHGCKLLIITGRELPDLQQVFDHVGLFDAIVAENGALLYLPAPAEERVLAPSPPAVFIDTLRRLGVPFSLGRSIIATWLPHDVEVRAVIRELGVDWQIIYNKGAVMCLPPGVNKASGLHAALKALQLSPLNVVGVGDAENDHDFLMACGCAVAVANALPALKAEADIVTAASHGAGVAEIVERFLRQGSTTFTAHSHQGPGSG